MSGNPFLALQPALSAIARETQVLPATGQAMEDLMRPDHAEVIDELRSETGAAEILDPLETPNRSPFVELKSLHRTEKHVFRYFLDGSARTFFIGDAVEGNRSSPVHVSQVGAAAVVRHDDGQVRIAKTVHRIVLMMDKNALSVGPEVERLVGLAGDRFVFVDSAQHDEETERTAMKEPRSRAAHKAHHVMSKYEEELGRGLSRSDNEWLILDGSLSKDLHPWRSVHSFAGLTKSFSRKPRFTVPAERGSKTVTLYGLLATLPFSARTLAFGTRAGKVVTWYVRIREQRALDYPLMGVVKAELPNPTQEAVSSELIDELSSALVAERLVAPHGKDIRWHAHLYAVYLAEQAVKNGFLSTETLKAGIRWPVLEGI